MLRTYGSLGKRLRTYGRFEHKALDLLLFKQKAQELCGDGHLAGFCGHGLVSHLLSWRLSAWKNAIGSMDRSAENMHGAHGIFPCTPPKGIPFRAPRPDPDPDPEPDPTPTRARPSVHALERAYYYTGTRLLYKYITYYTKI